MISRTTTIDGQRVALFMLAGVALLTAALLSMPVFAADEDTQASVYLVFDPETGEFVTMHDTDGTANAQETQEAIASVADVGEGSATAAPAPDGAGGATTNPTLLAVLVIAAIVVIGGAVFLQRKRSSA